MREAIEEFSGSPHIEESSDSEKTFRRRYSAIFPSRNAEKYDAVNNLQSLQASSVTSIVVQLIVAPI